MGLAYASNPTNLALAINDLAEDARVAAAAIKQAAAENPNPGAIEIEGFER